MLDRTKLPLPANWKDTLRGSMQLAEESGSTKAMRGLIENAESDVNGFGDAEIISDFASFKERSQSAFAYEETHGEDSLRKWDHPFNIRLCDMGLLKRPQEA